MYLCLISFGGLILWGSLSVAQSSCSNAATPTNDIQTSVASGYAAGVVATGLTSPRAIEFDSEGNLLVVQVGTGVSSHRLQDNGGTCLSVSSSKTLIENTELKLNHGLALSADESTLYVSSPEFVWALSYDKGSDSVGESNTTVVHNMRTSDHSTRTLLYSRKVDGMLVINRGSNSNLDYQTADEATGVSQVKAFNLSAIPDGGYDFVKDGIMLGWGLRNEVGLGEHPDTGGIWGVENSVDQLDRSGRDVHNDNPGEELNFLGYLNGTDSPNQGSNFGYPYCFAAWAPGDLPDNNGIDIGRQFASSTSNDSMCANKTAPRLTFQAHMAPLDIKFNNSGNDAWVSFHGSWDRDTPSGYFLGLIGFSDGEPVEPSTSNTSVHSILSNQDNTRCPDHCFRPVGVAFDSQGRLFMSSDATGEIYVVQNLTATSPGGNSSSSGGSGGGSANVGSNNAGGGSGSGSGNGSGSSGKGAAANIKVKAPLVAIVSLIPILLAYL